MRKERAQQRAAELNRASPPGALSHFAYHAGRGSWQVRVCLPGGKSELVEK